MDLNDFNNIPSILAVSKGDKLDNKSIFSKSRSSIKCAPFSVSNFKKNELVFSKSIFLNFQYY